MNVIAYTALEFATEVQWAAGVRPLTSPPRSASEATLPQALMAPQPRLLYLALHGMPGQPFLYGSRWITALRQEQIAALRLPNAIIFAPCCHLPQTPLLDAFLATGARAIIAGDGANYAPFVHQLGRWFRMLLALAIAPAAALKLARARLALSSDHPAAIDTLNLRIFSPKES